MNISLPNVLLTGEKGVGKTTLMSLLPGELLIELDDDMNEIVSKFVEIGKPSNKKNFNVREIDLKELLIHSRVYKDALESFDIVFIVTNSAASNLARTKKMLTELKTKVND
ncbi:MAG: hypothetical protein ACFE8J_16275, partial [Candidatus Heimdallarchaeota archaeon]